MSTADHPQTDGQIKRADLVVADVLRTVATPTIMEQAIVIRRASYQ